MLVKDDFELAVKHPNSLFKVATSRPITVRTCHDGAAMNNVHVLPVASIYVKPDTPPNGLDIYVTQMHNFVVSQHLRRTWYDSSLAVTL
jgi:hypothetical protein